MSKRFERTFELTDGETTRLACFRIPDAETGLEMADYFKDDLTGEQAKGFANLAARHLILLPQRDIREEQEIKSFSELEYIFSDPFIGFQLIAQFQEDIGPLLKRSMKYSRLSGAETPRQKGTAKAGA